MRIFVIAGEPSGDALGAGLMAALRDVQSDVTFAGVGGAGMEAQGLRSIFPMSDLSVMGLAEILPRYPRLRRRLAQTIRAAQAFRPDILLTVDSPGFTLRVARALKRRLPVHTVHYGAPSVWAWRPHRARRLRGVVDHLLALFPFEPPLFEEHGIRCTFVGHPAAHAPQATGARGAALGQRLGIGDAPMLLLLPGSRGAEVARLMPVMGQTLSLLQSHIPTLRPVLLPAPAVAGQVHRLMRDWPVVSDMLDLNTTDPDAAMQRSAAMQAADVALAASGSVTLELAAAGTPMVVAYDMHPVTRALVRRMLVADTVTLVNRVTDTRAVPEFLGRNCRPEPIAAALRGLLRDATGQKAALALCTDRLRRDGSASDAAARAVLDGWHGSQGNP